jgi:hypothetical protein
MQISGPSLAYRPMSSNVWWTTWLAQIAGNNTIPDQYSYHVEGGIKDVDNDPQYSNKTLTDLLNQYHLPQRLININEYGNRDEQIPSGAAWFIGRLERYQAVGLRGNWLGGTELHDLMANLVSKGNPSDYYAKDYFPVSEYQVYKYYNMNMTGHRVETTGSTDRQLDVYATVGADKVRVLAGVRVNTGNWKITINGLSAVGLPNNGTLSIQTWGFDGTSVWQKVLAPSDRGIASYAYSGEGVTIPVSQKDNHTAWAFEFSVKV